jgi:hypothetical protein
MAADNVRSRSRVPLSPDRFLNGRSLLAGSLGALAIALGAPYGTHIIHGSYMALDFSTPGAVFLFFVLVALVNGALRRWRPAAALSGPELIVAYVMMILASAIVTMGLSSQLPTIATAPYYYGNPENGWDRLVVPNLPPGIAPSTYSAIKTFYQGLPPGGSVPWGAWLRPMATWAPLVLSLYLVMICTMVLLRRQWIHRERLAYPLTQLPLAMVEHGRDGRGFWRSPVMWAGFGVPFFLGSLLALHGYWPAVPTVQLVASTRWFRDTASLNVRLSLPMLGFFYLANLDVVFSLWFFNLASQITRGAMNIVGVTWQENLGIYGSPSPLFAHLGMGALLALLVSSLWSAREHLAQAVRRALGQRGGTDDSDEATSYRTAFLGTAVGLAVMGVWLRWSGMPWLMVPFFLIAALAIFVGLTRIVAETGLAEAVAPTIAAGVVVSGFGSRIFGAAGLVSLGLTYVWAGDLRTFVMASAATGLRLGEILPERRRRSLGNAMAGAVVIALAVSLSFTIWLAYRHAGLNLSGWFFQRGPQEPYIWLVDKLRHPTDAHGGGWAVTALGAAVTGLLVWLRQTFIRWPLHPVGFCIGPVWIMDQLWFTCFLASVIKYVVLRLGGLRLFVALRPFFLGLILGQFTCNGFWLLVDAFTGKRGNAIFWI